MTHSKLRGSGHPPMRADEFDAHTFAVNVSLNTLEIAFRHIYGDEMVDRAIDNAFSVPESTRDFYQLDVEIRKLKAARS